MSVAPRTVGINAMRRLARSLLREKLRRVIAKSSSLALDDADDRRRLEEKLMRALTADTGMGTTERLTG